jgi:uncharacterized tellurite resistance protein B-like protein
MLLDSIRKLFGGSADGANASSDASPEVDPVHLAACALLLQVAHADGEFSAEERKHLEGALERHFDLPPEGGRRLLELAEEERREAIDQYRFTWPRALSSCRGRPRTGSCRPRRGSISRGHWSAT